jgi:S-adenosylmethionine hydrolase
VITLTTDFGLKDPYVAEMKGVILSINPKAQIIDITHGVDKFNVRTGAFVLASAAPYFPHGTVHVAVVDPGVGTKRRAILIHTEHGFFVGPDNGVLVLAAQKQGIRHIHELTNSKLMLPNVSDTFHGRDIFAPAAAHLDLGVKPQEFGPEVTDAVKPDFSTVKRANGSVIGEVLHVDDFGNVITNIEGKALAGKRLNLEFAHAVLTVRFAKSYGQAEKGEPVALVGSHGFLELALNQGSAAEKLGVKVGDKVSFKPV